MPTANQLCFKATSRRPRRYKDKRIAMQKCPQKRGTCLKVFTTTPRKPNSALRKITRLVLSNYRTISAYIPGIGHRLQKHSNVIVRGGRIKDLPGMKYTLVRGLLNFAPLSLDERRNARSRYGVKIKVDAYTKLGGKFIRYKYW